MAQADGEVANQSGAAVRNDINEQLAAIFTNHSGPNQPPVPSARQVISGGTTRLTAFSK